MKTILVLIEEHELLNAVMDTALVLARSFDSYIEGIASALDLSLAAASEIYLGDIPGLDPVSRQEMAATARRHFETLMAARGIARAEPGRSGLGYGWRQELLTGDELVGAYARVFDLSVLGRPSNRTGHPRMATLEAALFDSGRPVLLVPPNPPAALGDTVVVAWNRSTETARAVTDAMPFFARARQVLVLEIENWGVAGPTGRELADALERHGLPVRLQTVAAGPRGPGDTILSACQTLGADLLVKGAYTQSRLRQMIFGGATSHILANATIPVLLAH
jgi:nucleotide-binding universal stress UspA family protein